MKNNRHEYYCKKFNNKIIDKNYEIIDRKIVR